MAVLTKAQLRAAVDSVFATGQRITAEQARGEFHDWIDSLLGEASVVAGSGITVSQNADGSVTVAAGGAAASSGIPSFVAASAAQPSDDVLTATIAGVTDSPPFPSVVYLLTPSGLDRSADDLELQINGDTSRVRELVDFRGDSLAARDLDPAALYELLAHASPTQQYRLTEPIPLRLQDFDIVLGWFVGRTVRRQRHRRGGYVRHPGRNDSNAARRSLFQSVVSDSWSAGNGAAAGSVRADQSGGDRIGVARCHHTQRARPGRWWCSVHVVPGWPCRAA